MRAVVSSSPLLAVLVLLPLLSPRAAAQPAEPQPPPPAPPAAEPAPGPQPPVADAPPPPDAQAPVAADAAVGTAEAEAAAEEPEAAEGVATTVGDEIVVTAQKREDKLMEVPISISVVSAEALKATGAKNLTELQGVKPGVFFSGNTSYGGSPMAIRGTAGSNTALLDDPVAVYVDGIYLPSASFSTSTLLDIGSIEVARGPQGTLQGRNATAGAVLLRSADPKFALGGYGRASIAAPLEYRLEAAATGPVTDTFAVRAAFGYARERGWARNVDGRRLGSSESLLGRIVLLFEPTDALRLRLASTISSVKAEPALARWASTTFNPDPNGPLVSPPTPTVPLPEEDRENIEDGNFALNRPADSKTITSLNALEATYSFEDFADLVSVTGLVFGDTEGNNDSDGFDRMDREGFNRGKFDTQTVSEELRLQSNTDGRLSWILGGYYYFSHQDMDFRIYNLGLTLGAPTVPPPANRRFTTFLVDQDNTSLAGFADATVHILESLAATAGIRYTYEKKDFEFDTFGRLYPGGEPIPPPMPVMPPKSPTSWNDVSYRGKLTFTPIEPLLVYASISKGFKSGGYNAFDMDPAFGPEQLHSYELGVKAQLPERRGWFAASGYYNDYDGLQIRSGVDAGGVAIRNAADATIKGFEAEGQVKVVGGLSLQANVAFADARFEDFRDARDLLNVVVDITGARLPRTPKWQYFAQASYDQPLGDAWAARAEVSWRWRDKIYFSHTNQDSETVQGDPSGELGARLTFFYDPIDLSLAVFGTNLLNDRSVNGFNPNFSYPEVSFNKPRVVGVELEKKF